MSDRFAIWLSVIFFTGSMTLLTAYVADGHYMGELDIMGVVTSCLYGLLGIYFIYETTKDVGRKQ